MPVTYNVHSGVQLENNDILFTLKENPINVNVTAGGQIITDSDSFAFVYLLEDESGYHYVKFGQAIWPMLVKSLKGMEDPKLQFGEMELILHNFKDELEMLIFNIEGNDNYGADFSEAVENTFSEILKAE